MIIHLQENYVDLGIFHASDKDRNEPVEVWGQSIFAHGLFGKGQPELTCLEGYAFVRVLSAEQHVLQNDIYKHRE